MESSGGGECVVEVEVEVSADRRRKPIEEAGCALGFKFPTTKFFAL